MRLKKEYNAILIQKYLKGLSVNWSFFAARIANNPYMALNAEFEKIR